MADTRRTLSALPSRLADNTSGDISPQDVRDFLISAYPDAHNVMNHGAVGDGVTDDTEAFQALRDGEPVEMPDGWIQQVKPGSTVYLPNGTFLLKTLDIGSMRVV